MVKDSKKHTDQGILVVFRVVFYFSSAYFFLMGIMLILFPELLTRSGGVQSPIILGMLRGAGGSILPYSLLYILVGRRPKELRWVAGVIGIANLLAITLDLTSVLLGEYFLSYAMMDIPIEAISLLMIVWFYSAEKSRARVREHIKR